MPGPLHGLKVVEVAGIGPGPFAAMLLADLGADVIRVDRPGGGGLSLGDRDVLNRGRKSIAVDLKNPGGAEVILRLAEQADVLIEGYRPGVAERLGIGPAECMARNPRLVYGRMTGWGQEGPLAQSAGHDIAYIAITGALHAIGRAGGPPQVPLNLVGDFGGGSMYLVVGVLAAVWEAARSGQGQVVDAAIVDGTAHLAAVVHGYQSLGFWKDERGTNLLDTGSPYYDVYETSDGEYMAVGAIEPQFFAELIDRLGLADVAPPQNDQSRWPELRELFATTFRGRTRDEWTKVFDGTDACVAPVLSAKEAKAHPHIAARETIVERDGLSQPAPAPRFSRTEAVLDLPPCGPGAHTREALDAWGFSDVDALLEGGAVVQA
jgi:alpha-methylacyl-CoA racemase